MKSIFMWICLIILSLSLNAEEISLFSSKGKAVAYIDTNEELTIYLWAGTPVAYLSEDSAGGYHIYGFNGKHLGWFIKGILRDHRGDVACGVKDVMNTTQFEPFKGFKNFKPFKAFKVFSPFRPNFTNSFGQISCDFLLKTGSK